MARTTTAEMRAAGPGRKALERPAGAAEPDDPGNCNRVDPGENGPEFWPATREGIEAARERACWLSVARPPQAVTLVKPGQRPRVNSRWRGGNRIGAVPGPADRRQEQEVTETRTQRALEFEPEDAEGLPASFRLVAKDTPQQRDGRRAGGWVSTGPAVRAVLIAGMSREALQAHIADAVSWLAFDGTD